MTGDAPAIGDRRTAERPTVTVVIAAYADQRWGDLVAAVKSLERQTRPASQIVVIADHNPGLLVRARSELPGVTAIENSEQRGLAGARNSGVAAASSAIIAFLDDDAEATPEWLEHLVDAYDDPEVIGVGGFIEPVWLDGRPRYFPEEFNWVVGCSYRGLPRTRSVVRNMIGANMSFRREVFERAGGFQAGIGRIGTNPVGCEETELCIRAQEHWPQGAFLYEPEAVVRHMVPASRTRWSYFRSRCYAEGRSKAIVSQHVGARRGLESERAYATRTLPHGVLRGIGDALFRADPAGLSRAAAIVTGMLITTIGYLVGRLAGAARPGPMKQKEGRDGARCQWIEFDIHGSVAIRVSEHAPAAAQLKDMFEPFLTRGLERHDLTITDQPVRLEGAAHADAEYLYTSDSLYINASDVQILLDDGGFQLNSKRELLTSVLPLIDRILVTRDVAMIHAATVDYRGHGICLPAWGGTGKTSMIAKLLRIEGVAFMGDDWAFLDADGRLLGYTKPMLIKPYHSTIYPHLFKGARKPLVPSILSTPIAKLATLVHPVVTQYPRLARIARRWSPEHRTVTPQQAFPEARISTSAPLAIAIFVERTETSDSVLERKEAPWMTSRLIGNFHAEITTHSQEVITALGATGLVPLEQHFREKAAVLERALEDRPVFLLQVPSSLSADEASDVMVDHIHEALAEAGIS